MPTIAVIDGTLRPAAEATVSVFDRGFLYGDSVFETVRTYGGRPFALGQHLARLERSANAVYIPLPVSLDAIEAEVRRAIDAAGNAESYVRVIITRGSGPMGLDPSFEAHPLRVVLVGPLEPPAPETYERGIAVVTYRTQRTAEATPAASAKIGNYLVAVLAMREARKAGASEALIVDASGHVVEGASSNVFAVRQGVVITPPEDVGILPGITRATLLSVCREARVPVDLRPLSLPDLMAADEAFISSSIRELLPVVRVDEAAIADGRPGPVTCDLLRLFRKKISEIMALGGEPPAGPGADDGA